MTNKMEEMMEKIAVAWSVVVSSLTLLAYTPREIVYVDGSCGIDSEESWSGERRGSMNSPFRTVQYAVDRVASYGLVVVAPGTYDAVAITNTPVSLISSGTATNTFLTASVVLDAVAPGSSISGFTITGGDGTVASGYHCGGGLYLRSSASIRDCIIRENGRGNSASRHNVDRGGGVYVGGSNVVVRMVNCLVCENHAFEGSGIFIDSDCDGGTGNQIILENSTVANNLAYYGESTTEIVGGVCLDSGASVEIKDSILWGNDGSQVNGSTLGSWASVGISYSCLSGGVASVTVGDVHDGGEVIDENPCFASSWDSYWSGCNYELESWSPCLHAGEWLPDGSRKSIGYSSSRFADCATDASLFGYKLTEDGAVITNVSAKVSGDVVFPQILDGHLVVGIERDWNGNNWVFSCPTNITSIVIPEGWRFIGDGVFSGPSEGWHYVSNACSKMASISLPSTLRSIGSEAFRGCVSLDNISFPEGITNLPDGVVEYCTGLKCVTIPSTVEKIDEYAFRGCKIAYFRVSEDNPYYCSDYVGFLYDKPKKTLIRASGGGDDSSIYMYLWGNGWALPNTLEVIAAGAFQGYAPRYGIYFEIPASVTNIESGAFSDCAGVNATVAADNACYSHDWREAVLSKDGTTLVDYFGDGASYAIPSTVTNVGYLAFMASRGLSQLTIPNSVRTVGQFAFVWCEDLREIVLPKRVEMLDWSFAQCSGLKRVVMQEGSDLKYLYDGCFQYCTNLTEVVLTEGLEQLGGSVFWNCTALRELTIPESVTRFDTGAISECYALTNLFLRGRPVPVNGSWRGSWHPLHEDLVGYYRPKYAAEWKTVIDADGKWRGIRM